MSFEKKYVLESYNQISSEFDNTRHTPWPSVKKFIIELQPNSSILDAGCGNGKNMLIRKDLNWIGCDFCPQLLEICKKKSLNVLEADIKNLPFQDNYFDNCICIAAVHHLSSFNDRVKACQELIRVTKSKGKILIQVWKDQGLNNNKFKKIENREEGDYLISWTQDNKTVIQRFYHLYTDGEIDRLLSKLYGINVLDKYIEAGNWIFVLEKN
ncbi:methyltransferase [Indivirus ILV1]|uniref:Methyltransferase n=1 Tax=Indivirus ILV1 TaxID=1977633 RepID=A0A1V0SDW7_9VIRU|nr:methyltransferase [Indivirus ILV1]